MYMLMRGVELRSWSRTAGLEGLRGDVHGDDWRRFALEVVVQLKSVWCVVVEEFEGGFICESHAMVVDIVLISKLDNNIRSN
jgi:hypothetical protein